MSRHATDLAGRRFGYLLVERQGPSINGNTRWRCVCDCGRARLVRSYCLLAGETRSCGCRKEALRVDSVAQRRSRQGAVAMTQRKSFDAAWAEACHAARELAAQVGPRIRWEGDTTP